MNLYMIFLCVGTYNVIKSQLAFVDWLYSKTEILTVSTNFYIDIFKNIGYNSTKKHLCISEYPGWFSSIEFYVEGLSF